MTSYIFSVIHNGKRQHVESGSAEFDFFSILLNGKKIRKLDNKLDLEGPVTVTQPGLVGNEVVTFNQLNYALERSNDNALDILATAEERTTLRLLNALALADISKLNEELAYLKEGKPVSETLVAGGGGQTYFNFTDVKWVNDNTVDDVNIYVETDYQLLSKDGLLSASYRKLDDNSIEFTETIPQGLKVTAKIENPNIIIPMPPNPFDRSSVEGFTGTEQDVGFKYDIGTGKLHVYRDGRFLVDSPYIGLSPDKFVEKGVDLIELGDSLELDTVMTYIHEENAPTYRVSVGGNVGNILNVPSYVTGSGRLRVFRDGILLSKDALGDVIDQVVETDSTTLTFGFPLDVDTVITLENSSVAPTWFEEITGVSVTALNFSVGNSYTQGDGKLLIFKNGLLMVSGTGAGNPEQQYLESGAGGVTLQVAAEATDRFTVIYLG